MKMNCPACRAPVTDDALFCSHCGIRLPDDTKRIEIKVEDVAKLEEVRLKYQLEEKRRQDKNESKWNGTKHIKLKIWISWIICVISLGIGMMLYDPIPIRNNPLSTPFMILFTASGIYAVIITISYYVKKFTRKR